VLIRGAEIGGRMPLDLRIAHGRIAEIGAGLSRAPGEPVHEAGGSALLPGLHDHHAHLHALAAARTSIACGPPAVAGESQLAAALRRAAAHGSGWLRGVAYHESVAGELERRRLDAWVPERPLRIQHRSGALWILNSAGVRELGLAPGPEAETGRLFRSDAWLRERLGGEFPDLAPIGAQLAAFGITGVTDTSASNDRAAWDRFVAASESGALPQRVCVMGEPGLPDGASPRVARGAVKALLDDPQLPDFDALCARIRDAHAERRGFAVHCVTRAQLVFALAAFGSAGARRGDRIEHAAVAPPELVAQVAELGLAVVTQPHFVAERGDAYRRDVEPRDLPWLYRARGWLAAGVRSRRAATRPTARPTRGAHRGAVRRTSASGAALGADEALTPEQRSRSHAPARRPGRARARVCGRRSRRSVPARPPLARRARAAHERDVARPGARAAGVASAAAIRSAAGGLMAESNREIVHRMWNCLYQKDWDGVASLIDEHGLYEDVPAPDPGAVGPENVVKRLRLGLDPVQRFEHEIHRVVAKATP
jgi:predicted amidohydrolase YtcJ